MSNKNKNRDGIVYSTNPDYSIELSNEDDVGELPTGQQDLRIWLETKQRGGKPTTIIKGFKGSVVAMEELGKKLKQHCGCGGSVKDGEILIQGDMRTKVLDFLIKAGYKAKKAGS